MLQPEQSSKPRRKKTDVPIHGQQTEQKFATHKIFSANFNARKKNKNVEFVNNLPKSMTEELDSCYDPRDQESKPNRKQLNKEIERLRSENLQLLEQLNSNESLRMKKVTKLRDKLNAVLNFNTQLVNEKQSVKDQYEQLMKVYDDLRTQYEEAQQCKSCEQMKSALESSAKDYTLLRTTNKELLEDINMLKNVVYR